MVLSPQMRATKRQKTGQEEKRPIIYLRVLVERPMVFRMRTDTPMHRVMEAIAERIGGNPRILLSHRGVGHPTNRHTGTPGDPRRA